VIWLATCEGATMIAAALVVCFIASLTDLLDGYLARRLGAITPFGTLMDPVVDKMLALGLLFVFCLQGFLPLWLVIVNLFRELLVSGVRQVEASHGHVVGANWSGKAKFAL
jgi:CDP-diacylglycerol--glycerol-3-phosphate 3-phosphatidyltransferase